MGTPDSQHNEERSDGNLLRPITLLFPEVKRDVFVFNHMSREDAAR